MERLIPMKYILLILWSSMLLEAKSMVADYSVEFGIVGEVGKVHTQYTDDTKYYTIDTNLSVVGMLAKAVMHNLKERHICKGFIAKDGRRIATSYQMIKSYGEYKSMTLYTVNHKSKSISKKYQKWQKTKNNHYRKTQDYTIPLKYYATDDMVTLFLNLAEHIRFKNKAKHYVFKAVGADRKNGRVDINIPRDKETIEMEKLVGKRQQGDWLMNLVMHRQLYNSKQGELMVRMNKESMIEKAVLKDLLFFGDVRIIKK